MSDPADPRDAADAADAADTADTSSTANTTDATASSHNATDQQATVPSTDAEILLCIDITAERCDEALDDEITWTLIELGVQNLERQDDETWSELVEEPRPRARGAVRWRIHRLPTEDPDDAIADAFRAALPDDERLEIVVWRRDVTGYRTAWRDYFKPARVSDRVVVHPPWDRPTGALAAGAELIEIDPGMAFGTGTHETTRLCVAALDPLVASGRTRVLDVGCGSGILAIAAVRLGATEALGVDIDPDATREARRNAQVNGVGDRCAFETGSIERTEGTWELVIANILPHVLRSMSRELRARVAPGGHLLLSGILASEAPLIEQVFSEAPFRHVGTERLGDWTSVLLVREP